MPLLPHVAGAQGARIRVGILDDIANFDPHQFSFVNAVLIKNLYDSLLEYTPDGRSSRASQPAFQIAPDSKSVTLTLREGVKFHSGNPFNAEAVAANLKKAADPKLGKNVFPTMSFVKDWTVVDASTIRLNFKGPAPEQQVTDLLQFITIIDPAGIDTVEQKPAGTGAYMLGERVVGQRISLTANPNYWRQGEPVDEGGRDHGLRPGCRRDRSPRIGLDRHRLWQQSAKRRAPAGAGYQLVQGPGPLVQVFRINSTRGTVQETPNSARRSTT